MMQAPSRIRKREGGGGAKQGGDAGPRQLPPHWAISIFPAAHLATSASGRPVPTTTTS